MKRIKALAILLSAMPLCVWAEDVPLLPLDAVTEEWVFAPDLGWVYTVPHADGETWLWMPVGDLAGDWIYVSKTTYPLFWHASWSSWHNVHRIILNYQTYQMVFEEDVLTGKTFRSIEAYMPTEGFDPAHPDGIAFMRPSVEFRAENEMWVFYSDIATVQTWTYVKDRVLTDSDFVGDNLLYNPGSGVLFVNGYKFRQEPARETE